MHCLINTQGTAYHRGHSQTPSLFKPLRSSVEVAGPPSAPAQLAQTVALLATSLFE